MIDRDAEWLALVAEQRRATSAGLCNCCTTVVGRAPGRRVCWWTTPGGHREGLCARCLASWLENALDDPELRPVRLELCWP